MTRQDQRQETHDREEALRAQRAALEADLTEVAALIETESAAWAERRLAVQALEQTQQGAPDTDADEARMAWYLAAYEDAQHAVVVTQGLIQRYNEIARALTGCQQELMQLPRDHRRG
jgi:hypothetical protein